MPLYYVGYEDKWEFTGEYAFFEAQEFQIYARWIVWWHFRTIFLPPILCPWLGKLFDILVGGFF